MRDDIHLSADVYRPDRPGRFGAILEHIPYRKDDLRALQDRGQNLVLVEAGFVCERLDVRGTGSSEGVAVDEYTEAEQLDGVEVVDWMSRQDWCNGHVGSWGKSYGGFSCIQLAARRPRSSLNEAMEIWSGCRLRAQQLPGADDRHERASARRRRRARVRPALA